MTFVHHNKKMKYSRGLSDWLQTGADTGTLNSACCRLRKPFDCYYLEHVAEQNEQEMTLEMRQKRKDHGFLVEWQKLEFIALAP